MTKNRKLAIHSLCILLAFPMVGYAVNGHKGAVFLLGIALGVVAYNVWNKAE